MVRHYGISKRCIELQAKNERLKEGFRLYLILVKEQNFTPPETLEEVERFLDKKYELKNIIASGVICRMRKDLEQALKAKEKCKWTYDDDFWDTDCGKAFTIMEGTPKDNEMKYCPYCGRQIEQVLKGDK